MFLMVALLSPNVYVSLVRLSDMSTTSAVSIAASVPVAPMAIPRSATARAGASFIPSPIIATGEVFFNSFNFETLSSGRSSEK
ncbi:hypothetical protein SDC9_73175 [bioreactor metagenome]|uniref:Uncharacterized protein n=1 Tax=bioreactor metagenome TaxID=1076179 RepID=A0A644YFJ1_9ZZZZ